MSRTSLLASAFAEHPITVGGKALRPPTAGSIMLLMKTGNLLFSEDESTAATEGDILQAMLEFMWVHTEDKTIVVRTCQDPAQLREAAALMGMDLSFDDLSQLSQQFDAMQRSMSAALVDVVQEPGAKKPQEGTHIPTGLPPSSTPSEEQRIPSASITSSGSSPSLEPSNTSTPPTCTTEPAHVGRSPIWEAPPSLPDPDEDNVIPIC